MSNHPANFSDLQAYPSSIDTTQVLMTEEIPKLGSGKTYFGATKKIAAVSKHK